MELFPAACRSDPVRLRQAYLRLALTYHPDKVQARRGGKADAKTATKKFQRIQAAYEELSARLKDGGARGPQVQVRSAFAAACELGDVELVRKVLRLRPEAALEVDSNSLTPLMFAALGGEVGVCKLLLEVKADLAKKSDLGWTALTWAALHGHAETTTSLLQWGAEVLDKDFILLSFTGRWETFGILLQSCESGRAESIRDEKHKGLLHFALTGVTYLKQPVAAHLRCVDLALEAGCTVAREEARAARCEGVPVLLHVVRCMAEVWAAEGLDGSDAHLGLITRLLRLKADPRMRGPCGSNAIDLATSNGFEQTRDALLWNSVHELSLMDFSVLVPCDTEHIRLNAHIECASTKSVAPNVASAAANPTTWVQHLGAWLCSCCGRQTPCFPACLCLKGHLRPEECLGLKAGLTSCIFGRIK